MTQHKLFIGAVAITIAIGAAFFVNANSKILADSGTTYVVGQFDWQSGKGDSPIYLNEIQNQAPANWNQFWKDWVTGTFPGASSTVLGRPLHFANSSNITTGDRLIGKSRTAVTDSYLISAPYQFNNDTLTSDWQHLSFRYKGNKNEFRFYYRIADDNGTTDPNDSKWVEVTGLTLNNQFHVQKLSLNKTGKTFQYKMHLKDTTSISTGVVVTAREKTVAVTPTVNPTVSAGVTATPSATSNPSPAGSPIVRRSFGIWQRNWKAPSGTTTAVVNSSSAKAINTKCAPTGDQVTTFGWDNYAASAKIGKSVPQVQGQKIVADVGPGKIDTAYLISQPFTINLLNADNTINWDRLNISFAREAAGSIKLYYRVFDTEAEATDSATASDWIEVADPSTVSPVKDGCESGYLVSGYRINKTGKYFQYKIHLSKTKKGSQTVGQNVTRIGIYGDEQSVVVANPTPTPTSTPTGSLTPSPEASGVGKITLVTRYLTPPPAAATPSPVASGPALPNLTTPTPSPIASPDATNPACTDDGEIAPDVPVKVKQLTNGSFVAEDETTDDEGMWQGLDGEIDEFPNGNYQITFGAFQNATHKLVGFCVTPDNGLHYYKTQADPATGKITIIVRPGLETKVVALYGLRSLPYISMSKLAIDAKTIEQATTSQQRVMKIVYPGQSFLYRIKYTNTSDTAAKNVLIQDVLPKEFDVPDEVLNDVDNKYNVTLDIDAQGRTIIKRQIPELKAKEEGVIYIPVTLRASAFDSGV